MRSAIALALMLCACAADAAAPVSKWQCSPAGASAMSPALAEAARDYLGRVEAIYPRQVLGLVRAGDRYYLLNSHDVEWSERNRLYLLALRLREPYLTSERQETGAAPGSQPPPGSFVCLALRAEREGLTRTPFGEVVLAAGQSVHLVDPHEPQVAVEVRAGHDQPLNLGEIFHRSARAGIYAGLTGQMSGPARPPAGGAAIERPDGTLVFRTASAGGSVVETRVAQHPDVRQAAPAAPVPDAVVATAPVSAVPAAPKPAPRSEPVRAEQPAVVVAPAPPPAAPEKVAIAAPLREPEPPPMTEPPAPVVVARPVPVSAPPAPAPIPESPEIVARAAPAAPTVLPSTTVVVKPVPAGAVPPAYDDYAKAMKTLMALKRSRSVLSVGEMTYVHPAVEVLRRMP